MADFQTGYIRESNQWIGIYFDKNSPNWNINIRKRKKTKENKQTTKKHPEYLRPLTNDLTYV